MITLRHAFLTFEPYGALVTFRDGSKVASTPHQTPHYYVIAHRLGYGDDVMAYCREHEFAHLFMEEAIHDRPSRVLYGLARGAPLSDTDALYEEAIAQMFQRWLRANERPILGGIDWDDLKQGALHLLRF